MNAATLRSAYTITAAPICRPMNTIDDDADVDEQLRGDEVASSPSAPPPVAAPR